MRNIARGLRLLGLQNNSCLVRIQLVSRLRGAYRVDKGFGEQLLAGLSPNWSLGLPDLAHARGFIPGRGVEVRLLNLAWIVFFKGRL